MEILRRNPLPLQIAVVAIAISLTALLGYQIEHTTSYGETATVVFTVRQSPAQVDASFGYVQSLTTTAAAMVQTLMSQDPRTIARQAGGTATFTAEVVNYYNEDYPDYAYPFATLVVRGPALEGVQATFKVVILMLRNMLFNEQAQAGVHQPKQITISIIDDTGPFAEKPSRVRSYTALCALSVIVTSMSLIFIRRILPRGRARSFARDHRAVRRSRHRVVMAGKICQQSIEGGHVRVKSEE